MNDIIKIERSIIPACDVDVLGFEKIIDETHEIDKIGAYKIGASLALSVGLPRLAQIAKKHTNKPLIYDHQKAGTDIPDTGKAFMEVVKGSGIDAVIIFPMSGPVTQTAWLKSANEIELPIIAGGHMTHESYRFSEGGYIEDNAIKKMFSLSADLGVENYVVPGNKPMVIKELKNLLQNHGVKPVFYSPGFVLQGGDIGEAAVAAGSKWHAIIGRAIYTSQDIHGTALSLTDKL